MVKLSFFVPVTHLEPVKEALFNTGAGRIGDYEHCCWQTLGLGQFKPMAGSAPFIGEQDKLEQVEEYKVEMVCDEGCLDAAIIALKTAHPYEEPAYDVMALLNY